VRIATSLLFRAYQLTSCLIFTVAFPVFFLYSCCTGKHRTGLGERFGFFKSADNGTSSAQRIWLHAASVGEVQVARALIDELKKEFPDAALILSTMTEQGQRVARQQLGPEVRCIFAPLDLPQVVRRAVDRLKPTVYLCLETELWPNLLHRLEDRRIPAILLNGRLSERSFRRYEKIRGFMARVLNGFAAIAVIRPDDAKRYVALGAAPQRVSIVGNAKYDLTVDTSTSVALRIRRQLGLAPDQPLLVAGSTHGGEEAMLLETLHAVQTRLPDLVLALAPRHLERLPEVTALLSGAGEPFDLLSHCKANGRTASVVVVDTMGELSSLYGAATFVFCGGSLVPRGGHNLMEAAIWGRPVCYGPDMKDFLDARELLETAGAGFTVASPQALADTLLRFIDQPDLYATASAKAQEVALAQQGAARRQVQLVKTLLN